MHYIPSPTYFRQSGFLLSNKLLFMTPQNLLALKDALMWQERIASFHRTLDACHSQASALEASIAAIWQGIFSARFRDVDADIRATVIRGIGEWMSLNPADFLNDNYLKYVAWALSDRVSTVRPWKTSVYFTNTFEVHIGSICDAVGVKAGCIRLGGTGLRWRAVQ